MNDPYLKHFQQLVGKTVSRVVVDSFEEEGEENSYGLLFTDGTLAWILCDPEGNGPGFLEIIADV